ncbi:hypothetical protein PBI_SMARTIES_72 [Microbacterium phage Smarties]|uniref:Uncharacterized protein n=1 Tax=Microbacterium phage Ariadne TaxID=2656546 RepID=A0A649VBR1_9CAUD|nr:hypothetical protein QDA10_gp072 [Microbacterium phage Ariadne]QGJ89475.1 hypothetical protein PBI_ARIADNE_72 [Microbacterium phage Ariadne]QGJ91462.1 hypothetical protein PBI_SMARTIES_72 [Microbacterium phage Smarties]
MRVQVKTSQGGGMFGGGPSSEVTIEATGFETPEAVIAAMHVLAQNGIGEHPTDDDEDTETEMADGPIPPAAFGEETDAPYDETIKSDPTQRLTEPGDAVRLVWPGGESRLFIDNGSAWVSPYVAGLFDEPMTVEYTSSEVTAYVVASQPERGTAYQPFTESQE